MMTHLNHVQVLQVNSELIDNLFTFKLIGQRDEETVFRVPTLDRCLCHIRFWDTERSLWYKKYYFIPRILFYYQIKLCVYICL